MFEGEKNDRISQVLLTFWGWGLFLKSYNSFFLSKIYFNSLFNYISYLSKYDTVFQRH